MRNPQFQSHGSGHFTPQELKHLGRHVIFEEGVLIFHPEVVEIGDNVYVGHRAILKGYYSGFIRIANNVWIGQGCFIHGAGGVMVGNNVGIGPNVSVITSTHRDEGPSVPILFADLAFAPVVIEDDSDIGVGAILLPGVTIGRGSQIGAGAVVTKSVPPFSVAAGVPARVLRRRG